MAKGRKGNPEALAKDHMPPRLFVTLWQKASSPAEFVELAAEKNFIITEASGSARADRYNKKGVGLKTYRNSTKPQYDILKELAASLAED
tara:strand:+ start:2406 stop:2675 length:270 start_codon:yes stop_codon:yes gene_type:complete